MTRLCMFLMTLTTLMLTSAVSMAQEPSSASGSASATRSTATCEELRGLNDALRRGLTECTTVVAGERAARGAVVAGLRADLKAERERGDRLALEIATVPDPVIVGGVGAVVGAAAVVFVWWLAVR